MRVACLLALAFFAACEQPRKSGSLGLLSPDIFEDLPVPKGAVYRQADEESFSYRGATFRCGKFVYDYRGTDEDTVRFFQETMTRPPYNWTLAGEDRPAEGTTTFVFTKNDDRCTVDIDRLDDTGPGEALVILVRLNYRR